MVDNDSFKFIPNTMSTPPTAQDHSYDPDSLFSPKIKAIDQTFDASVHDLQFQDGVTPLKSKLNGGGRTPLARDPRSNHGQNLLFLPHIGKPGAFIKSTTPINLYKYSKSILEGKRGSLLHRAQDGGADDWHSFTAR